jgi:hypothetical protein
MPKSQTINEPDHIELPSKNRMALVPWVLLVLVLLAGAGFVFRQHREAKQLQNQLLDLKQNPQKATEEESKALLDKVGQLIELPNEQPTIATVTDLSALKDQAFFANAQVDDKVLIFSNAKKAILYRPSTNKIIEVAPVNLDSTPAKVNTSNKSLDTSSDTTTNTKSPKTTTNTNSTNE